MHLADPARSGHFSPEMTCPCTSAMLQHFIHCIQFSAPADSAACPAMPPRLVPRRAPAGWLPQAMAEMQPLPSNQAPATTTAAMLADRWMRLTAKALLKACEGGSLPRPAAAALFTVPAPAPLPSAGGPAGQEVRPAAVFCRMRMRPRSLMTAWTWTLLSG